MNGEIIGQNKGRENHQIIKNFKPPLLKIRKEILNDRFHQKKMQRVKHFIKSGKGGGLADRISRDNFRDNSGWDQLHVHSATTVPSYQFKKGIFKPWHPDMHSSKNHVDTHENLMTYSGGSLTTEKARHGGYF